MERLPILRRTLHIFDDGRDPNGIKAHVLDIVQLGHDALPRPATILPVTRVAGRPRAVRGREAVCYELRVPGTSTLHLSIGKEMREGRGGAYLVDCSVPPVVCGRGQGGRHREGREDPVES